jgi:hypothetical protein
MKLPSAALQQALYETLSAALSCQVYDDVPENAAFPYCVIGEESCRDWGTKSQPGKEVEITLHFWSQKPGFMEVKQLANAGLQALTASQALQLDEFTVVQVQFLEAGFGREDDGVTRSGTLRLGVKIMEV